MAATVESPLLPADAVIDEICLAVEAALRG